MARNNLTQENSRHYKNLPDACVPYDSVFHGDIETKAGIRIDGGVKGNVTASGGVTIGSDGNVEGTVTGKDINIAGSVNGNVNSYGTVQMITGAKLIGDLQASSVAIEQGAYFKGKCTITDNRAENAKDCLGKPEFKSHAKLIEPPDAVQDGAEQSKTKKAGQV